MLNGGHPRGFSRRYALASSWHALSPTRSFKGQLEREKPYSSTAIALSADVVAPCISHTSEKWRLFDMNILSTKLLYWARKFKFLEMKASNLNFRIPLGPDGISKVPIFSSKFYLMSGECWSSLIVKISIKCQENQTICPGWRVDEGGLLGADCCCSH